MASRQTATHEDENSTLRHRAVAASEEQQPVFTHAPDKRTSTTDSLHSLLTSQVILCNVPILILVVVASLDNADKQLLASSFPMLEKALDLDVEVLGYFSMFTNLSYAFSLPLWGYLLHTHGMEKIHILLSVACGSWGLATIGIAASGSSIWGQAIFRCLVGAALGSILPLSQTLLVELVPDVSMRGRAFGLMGLCEKLAGTLAAASVVYLDNWQHPYYALGIFSVLMAVIAHRNLDPKQILPTASTKSHPPERKLSFTEIIQQFAKIPAFLCLVAQGAFGGTPWDMMSFLLLLLDWRGFTKEQIISIQFTLNLSATIGGWLGGVMGDYAEQRIGIRGRIGVALTSVVGGIPLYGLFLYSKSYPWALLWVNLFHLVATWPSAGALRPLCAALTRNPSERAQIVSMWIVLEKASGAIFGAPLVGYLTSKMLTTDQMHEKGVISQEKAHALAMNLFGLSTFFWSICATFWLLMAYTLRGGIGGRHFKTDDFTRDKDDKDPHLELAPLV
jgi:MFS family permease